jgi:MazG family protein
MSDEIPIVPADDPRLVGLRQALAVMDRLRGEGGCPWDRVQTHASLRPFLVEETFELLEQLDRGDGEKIREELGDVLFQVLFHARLAQEERRWDLGDVAHGISAKLVRRHPHVFAPKADDAGKTPDAVVREWDEHKRREGRRSALDGVPRALPALLRAQRVSEKAARVGFDWPDPRGPVDKLDEELREVRERLEKGDREGVAEELGDLAVAFVNLARHVGVVAEDALRVATDKFERRFRRIEELAGGDLKGLDLAAMDRLWDRVKGEERAATAPTKGP